MSIRASVHQGGPRGGGGSGARARRSASQRPGGGAHVRRQGGVRRASSEGTAPRAARDPGSGGVHATRQRNESRRGATLRREAAAPPRDRGGPLGFPGRRVGRPARTARRRPRRRRDHDRRSAGTRAPGRRVGRHGGRGDRPAGAARHEPRADPNARARRRRTAAPGASPEAGPGGRGPRGAAHQRAVRRAAAPRVRRAGTAAETMTPRCAALGILVSWRVALGQGSWTATPASPTVGDTVWLERQIPVPAGWRVRPGKLDATERVEPLADPSVRRAPQGWLVRYPIVAWAPGPHALTLPPVWRLAPDGRADSVAGGVANFFVQSVIPDTIRGPQPRGALAPVRLARRSALPPAAALLLASGGLALGLGWRRRAPLAVPAPRRVALEPEVADARWLAAGEPKAVAALAALPLWWWLRGRRLGRLRGTRMSDVRPAAGAGERLWIARLPVTLRSLCVGAWIVAAAGPRVGSARAETRSEGISIVLAIDLSSSMLSEDFSPANRIDVAKQTAIEFVRERRSDRIGLVAFAAQALTQVPITTDYAVLEQALRDLRIGMIVDGTAIGTGIATAANRLRRAPGKSRVIVLLTDGVNNRGTVDPRTAAQAAAAFGIRIYVIGVGP